MLWYLLLVLRIFIFRFYCICVNFYGYQLKSSSCAENTRHTYGEVAVPDGLFLSLNGIVDKSSLAVGELPNWGIFSVLNQSDGQDRQFHYPSLKKLRAKCVKTFPNFFLTEFFIIYFSKNLPRTFPRSRPVQEISHF